MHGYSVSVGNQNLLWLIFVEDVISWLRANHEYHKNWATIYVNHFTVVHKNKTTHCWYLVFSPRYSRPTNYVMVNTHENNWIQFKHKFFLSLWHPGESEIVHFFFPVLWRTLTLSSSDVSSCMCVFYHLIKKIIAFSLLVLAITFFKA